MNLLVKCPLHPEKYITNVYIREDCPLPSRLVCNKCLHNNKELIDGFLDFDEFLQDPLSMFSVPKSTIGDFDNLNIYFQKGQKDLLTIIDEYQHKINQLIQQLKQDIYKEIEEFRNYQAQMKQAQAQFVEAVGIKQLKESFQQLIKIENYHSKQEWTYAQEKVQEYVKQFIKQDSNQLKQTFHKLENNKDYFQGQVFANFNNSIQKYTNELVKEFQSIGASSTGLGDLCRNMNRQLMLTIDPNQKIQAKLLFKGTQHGMNANSFWSKCQNQGPTLTICKSANGTVFGGYTPCKWVANGAYVQDATLKSFLFNANRNEIYKNFDKIESIQPEISIFGHSSILQDSIFVLSPKKSILEDQHSILGHYTCGLTFGRGPDLYIAEDFKGGYSKLGHSYRIENQDKIQNFNQSTHLMGDTQPNLVEMEVYLIEPKK